MTSTHDTAYALGDAIGWHRCDYHRDQYGEIDGITDGTHTMYITVTDGDCMWELYETDSDGQSDMLGSGHCPEERATVVLIRMWHDAMI